MYEEIKRWAVPQLEYLKRSQQRGRVGIGECVYRDPATTIFAFVTTGAYTFCAVGAVYGIVEGILTRNTGMTALGITALVGSQTVISKMPLEVAEGAEEKTILLRDFDLEQRTAKMRYG